MTKITKKKKMAPSLSIITLIFFFLTLTFPSPNHALFSKSISREELGLKAQNTQTHLTFYYHDTLSGPNPTTVQIANASTVTGQSASSFGLLAMFDDPLMDGPETTSKMVGRAQGVYGSADQNVFALTMIMTFLFLEGGYSGSTLSVLGRDQRLAGVRELPVVGGTGAFRFAKGYAQARTVTSDQETRDAVLKFDVYVSHADSRSTSSNRASPLSGVSLSAMACSLLLIRLLYEYLA